MPSNKFISPAEGLADYILNTLPYFYMMGTEIGKIQSLVSSGAEAVAQYNVLKKKALPITIGTIPDENINGVSFADLGGMPPDVYMDTGSEPIRNKPTVYVFGRHTSYHELVKIFYEIVSICHGRGNVLIYEYDLDQDTEEDYKDIVITRKGKREGDKLQLEIELISATLLPTIAGPELVGRESNIYTCSFQLVTIPHYTEFG